jgi:rubrerythrin
MINDLKFAIDMELEGEKYYRQQAQINKDNSLYTVCLMMADEEKEHANILSEMAKEQAYKLSDTHSLSKAKGIFNGIQDIKSDVKDIMSQLDFYRVATENEKKSMDLYTKYLNEVSDQKEKELFEYLIRQEKQHYEILEELASLLQQAEEWVEFAEFGIRKEY